jgi:hypothetical protein
VRAAICLAGFAFEALNREAYELAAPLMRDALPDALATDNRYLALMIEGNTGLLALLTGDLDEARDRFAAELRAGREEALTVFVFEGLLGFGALAALNGRDELAAILRAAGEAHNVAPIRAVERVVFDRIEDRFYGPVRERLGDAAWEKATAHGRTLSADSAIELAVSEL